MKQSTRRRSLVATTASVAILGAGSTAFAVATGSGSDPAGWSTVEALATSTPSTTEAAPTGSEAQRQAVTERVALLRTAKTDADRAPASYVPPAEKGGGLGITRDDLIHGKRLPGAGPPTWAVPLRNGNLALVRANGGVETTPDQLESGTIALQDVADEGSIVTGLVPDQVEAVKLVTSDGSERTVRVQANTYVATFPKGSNPQAVTFTANGRATTAPLPAQSVAP